MARSEAADERSPGDGSPRASDLPGALGNDHPIDSAEKDLLGRADPAGVFARNVLALDASEGLVVAVAGPWGAGKTSFINLSRPHFEDACAAFVSFNPWMFSGATELVGIFFAQVGAQLKLGAKSKGLKSAANAFGAYGDSFSHLVWVPVVGPWAARAGSLSRLLSQLGSVGRAKDLSRRRAELEGALRRLDDPVVVVIDDIDRLTPSEVQDIFKLVRLTGSFPNLTYILSFDRVRVEAILGDLGIPGRDYLEKIAQMVVDLPDIPDEILTSNLARVLDSAIAGIEDRGPFEEAPWPDIFMEIIRPLVRNMRDARRYAVSVRWAVASLGRQVALHDVLALEAVRVLLPDVFAEVRRSVDALTNVADAGAPFPGAAPQSDFEEAVSRVVDAGGESHRDVAEALIERLFPAAKRFRGGPGYGPSFLASWLKGRRVAHADILRCYLQHQPGEGASAFNDAEEAWNRLGDRAALESFLLSLPRERLQDVIAALEAYEHDFERWHLVPGISGLLNVLPELPDRPRGLFEPEPRIAVGRVVLRMLRRCKTPDEVADVVDNVLPEVRSLSAQWELITDVGHREGAGHRLVSHAKAATLEDQWVDRVVRATPEELACEHELLRVMSFARRRAAESGRPAPIVPQDSAVTLALLRSARATVRGQADGSRFVRSELRLRWDGLTALYGSEGQLSQAIADIPEAERAQHADLLGLAKKYAEGWRPEEP